jgi:hypothetical protein
LDEQQLELFSPKQLRELATPYRLEATLQMSGDYLQTWKAKIVNYQQQIRLSQSAKQTALFNPNSGTIDVDLIDPLTLPLYNLSFSLLPTVGSGNACLYFVLDIAAQLLLYVGETCQSHKRWKGEHDCKRYLDNYASLHYKYHLKTALNISFWWHTPRGTKKRQQMELAMITKWRSPFNKENWELWGTPFV